MASLQVDFAQEQIAAYQQIFAQAPRFSVATWNGVFVAYDYLLPGQTPEVCAKQHGMAIFIDLPTPAWAERTIAEQFRREQVQQGDLIIVPANTWNRSVWDAAGSTMLIGFEPQEFARISSETIERDWLELLPHFATSDPLIYQIGLALKRALQQNNRLYGETMATALMVHLMQHYTAQRPMLPNYSGGLSPAQLQQVTDYIQAHLDQDLSLNQLAAIVKISAHYFSELFKQSTGLSPHQYVIYRRVERAKELLKYRTMTIAEVASRVGFVDQSHLHRHFKRWVGMTPKAFVQQL